MKNLLITAIISGAIFFLGCQKENPVSPIQNTSKHSLQKQKFICKIPVLFTEPIYASFQTSGYYLNISKFSILEIYGNTTITGIGSCKIFLYAKIISTTQTGTIDITTDKGDKIAGTLSGTVQAGRGNVLHFSGNFKLLHGTGDFNGFTGDGKYFGNINKNGIDGKLVLDGVIYIPEIIRANGNPDKFQHDKVQKVRLDNLAIIFK